MKELTVTNEGNTFERLGLELKQAVTNICEGLCFLYGIPKNDRQLVIYFSGIACHNNYEAILNWVLEQALGSDATTDRELNEEIKTKFSAKLEQLC